MAIARKQGIETKGARRIWKTPGSRWNWLFLGASLGALAIVLLLTFTARAEHDPNNDPFRAFGILAFGMILVVTSYTLRRRMMRQLPGKVQDWLWLHIWLGIASVIIVCIHENWQNIAQEFSFTSERFTEAAFGTTALYALLLLVLSGIVGRLLDFWQARVIATEADTNGAGIERSVEERLEELTLAIERLSAGKSALFKQYCAAAASGVASEKQSWSRLPSSEMADFQRVQAILINFTRLQASLQRQQRARQIIRAWRLVHIPLACASLLVISYHALYELLQMAMGQ